MHEIGSRCAASTRRHSSISGSDWPDPDFDLEPSLSCVPSFADAWCSPANAPFDPMLLWSGDAVTAVKSGAMLATVAQQAARIGSIGVETADAILKGKSVAKYSPVPLQLITK